MKLSRAVLDVMRGATGAAMMMSVGCSSMGQAAAPPPAPARPVVLRPVSTTPVVMQPLPSLPRGADVPSDLVPLPAAEPTLEEPTPGPSHASHDAPRNEEAIVGELLSRPTATPASDPYEELMIGPLGVPPEVAANCGRG